MGNFFHLLTDSLTKIGNLFPTADPALRTPIAISLGAIAGALSRYYLTLLSLRLLGTGFPYGTFFINLSGALVMGFFVTLTIEKFTVAADLRLLIAVGFLGSYTTFSTYALETANFVRMGSYNLSLLYCGGSALLGWVCIELGSFLARRLL